MVRRGAAAVALCALGACGGQARPAAAIWGAGAASGEGSEITLYQDAALVQQRVEVDAPAGGAPVEVRVRLPAGVGPGDVRVLPQAGLEILSVRAAGVAPAARPAAASKITKLPSLDPDTLPNLAEAFEEAALDEPAPDERPTELELTVRATGGRPGRAALRLAYVTHQLGWEAAYTIRANAARDRATLTGALSISNTTGIALPGARLHLVDAPHADARARAAAALAARFTGAKPAADPSASASASTGSAAPPPPTRDLGRIDLADGETRVALTRAPVTCPMRSVLLYDPVGAGQDRGGSTPATEPDLGLRPPAGPRVDESFEIDARALRGRRGEPAALPAGTARLLEERADGSLALLGEARLFESSGAGASASAALTISVGTAEGVTGRRERRELTVDKLRKRVAEEFVITIDNARPHPVRVLIREHLYRGLNWTLAYISVPVGDDAKEGPQQVAPRITVPARSQARVMYTVVYWW